MYRRDTTPFSIGFYHSRYWNTTCAFAFPKMEVDFKKQNVRTFENFMSPWDSPRLIFCILWWNYAYRTQDSRLKKSLPDKNSYCISANAMQFLPILTQIWPYHKKFKGHPSIIIYWCCILRFSLRVLLVLEKKSFKCFTICGYDSHLVQWHRTIWTN